MTQTPRDWQKDEALLQLCQRTAADENEKHVLSIGLHWLQEAKTLQEIASGRGREALRLSKLLGDLNNELTASEERADAAEINRDKAYNMIGHKAQEIAELRTALGEAEAREQRLKEAIQSAHLSLTWCNTDNRIPHAVWYLEQVLSLYPDTPAQP
ncbi:hypothetical protein [Paenibacillus sp. FSL R10-2771]|uniref:hypothetical protein n=1 Tax=Paenibacillus sp. FSL R10-2771 TaxID=2954693 RepID=UPI0030F7F88C